MQIFTKTKESYKKKSRDKDSDKTKKYLFKK